MSNTVTIPDGPHQEMIVDILDAHIHAEKVYMQIKINPMRPMGRNLVL